MYSFSLYTVWENNSTIIIGKDYDFSLQEQSTTENNKQELSSINLANFKFLNQKMDSISLLTAEKYTIIETWNEQCPPCMKAIPEMSTFYHEIAPQANQYYVYVPPSKNKKIDYNKLFAFDKIADKSKILVDINLQQDANLSGYPYFLVFDKEGKLVHQSLGYASEQREELQEQILRVVTNGHSSTTRPY